MPETSKSNWPGRKVRSWHWGRLLPPKSSDQEYLLVFLFFFFPIPPFLYGHLIPNFTPWKSLWFFCSPFALFWPGKILLLFTYLRPLQRGVIQPPNNCWICHDAGDRLVLCITNFSLISNTSFPQPPLYLVFPVWLTVLNPGILAFRFSTK